MVSLVSGDATELYFHLSLDHSEQMSSEDDFPVHTMDEHLAFLRLARAHDSKVRAGVHQRGFSGDETIPPRETALELSFHGPIGQSPLTNRARRHFSDPVVASGAAHSTPLHGERGRVPKSWQFRRSKDDPEDALYRMEPGARPRPRPAVDPVSDILGRVAAGELDGKALFRMLQQYAGPASGAKTPRSGCSPALENAPVSDVDSAADDTFDIPRRAGAGAGARTARVQLSSPVTSPPQSGGDAHFNFEENVFPGAAHIPKKQPERSEQIPSKPRRRQVLRAPQIELADLTADELSIDLKAYKEDEAAAQREAAARAETMDSVRLMLDQYRKDNDGMRNEIEYLRSKVEMLTRTSTMRSRDEDETHGGVQNQDAANLDSKNPASGMWLSTLPDRFMPYYHRYGLHKVDALSSAEKSSVIKNFMLLLLVTDYDHLSTQAPKVGKFLSLTGKFIDDMHSRLYPDEEMLPLRYLTNYAMNIEDGLEACLKGMMEEVFES